MAKKNGNKDRLIPLPPVETRQGLRDFKVGRLWHINFTLLDMDVEAEDKIAAVRAAGKSSSHLWNPMPDDDVIEAYDVVEKEKLNKQDVVDLSINL